MEATMEQAAPAAQPKKKMPATREEFRLAANWLARNAIRAGNAVSALLAGPAADDQENGICIGYRDGRDQPWPKKEGART